MRFRNLNESEEKEYVDSIFDEFNKSDMAEVMFWEELV